MSAPEVRPYTRVPGDGYGVEYERGAVGLRFHNGASVLLTAEEANDLRMRLQELWIAGKLR